MLRVTLDPESKRLSDEFSTVMSYQIIESDIVYFQAKIPTYFYYK